MPVKRRIDSESYGASSIAASERLTEIRTFVILSQQLTLYGSSAPPLLAE
jgi:hypothetical protein